MSRFSGKFDFCDEISVHGLDYILHKCRVYVGDELVELKTLQDCIPYYPHIPVMTGWDGESGVIHLSARSWVDIEEERYGHMLMHDIYREVLRKEMEAAENEAD